MKNSKKILENLKISPASSFFQEISWFSAWSGIFFNFCDAKIMSEPQQVQINGKFKQNLQRSQEIPSFPLFSRILANFLVVQENFFNFNDAEIALVPQFVEINENFK